MNAPRTTIARAVASVFLGAALCAAAVPAFTQPYGEGGRFHGPRAAQLSDADRAQLRERMQARMSQRFDRLAARLEIKASQEEAWGQFRKSIESTFQGRPQRPKRDADAATLTRFRAELAQRRAKDLLTVADATAKLQQALEPDQRKVLDEVVRNMGPDARRSRYHRHHWHGPRAERGRG